MPQSDLEAASEKHLARKKAHGEECGRDPTQSKRRIPAWDPAPIVQN
jgi:hypothetical protein